MPGRRRRARPLVVDIDPEGSLANGTVVDTRIVARLGKVPLLRLEGTVVLTPGRAHATAPPTVPITVPGELEPAPAPPVAPAVAQLPAPEAAETTQADGDGRIGADLPDLAERLARLRQR